MNDLKNKTIYGLIWNFVERFFNYFFQFIVGIILARILSPKDFGLMGMLAIFIALSQVLISSGLNSAIIRKKTCEQKDYSTVFVFNIASSLFFFILLFLLAKPIGIFYDQPILESILIVLAFGLVIEALGGIQLAKLQREMNFKLQTKITLVASFIAGIVSISMALLDYGIWSLVALHLTRVVISTILIWIFVKWRPSLLFDKQSFKELFSFGSRLLLSGLIDTVYDKGFYLLIGKLYTPARLGFFNRAERFENLVSRNISGWIAKVSYPMLSQIKDTVVLRNSYRKIIQNVMFITFVLLFGLAATSEALILSLLGEKWADSVIYLQMLVFAGMLHPIQALNTEVLKVFGRSDLFLRVVIIKKSIAIPLMIVTAFISIKVMILGMIFMSVLSFIINVHWSNKFINYPLMQQVKDIFPSFVLALLTGVIVYFIGYYLQTVPVITLIIQVLSGFIFVVAYCEITKQSIYLNIKSILIDVYRKYRNKE